MSSGQKDEEQIKQFTVQLDQVMAQYVKPFLDQEGLKIPGVTKENRDHIFELLRTFNAGIIFATSGAFPKMTEEDVGNALRRVDYSYPKGDKYVQLFYEIAEIGYMFLRWLSAQNKVELTLSQINGAYRTVSAAAGSVNEFPSNDLHVSETDGLLVDPGRAMYYYDRETLPMFQREVAIKVWQKTEKVATEFIEQGHLKRVAGETTGWFKDDLVFNLMHIAIHLYGEHRQKPTQWTAEALKDILTGYVVKDAAIFPDEYSQFGEILKAFMDFAVEKRLTSKQVAERMKQAIEEIEPEMIRLGADQTHFSADKKWWLKTTNPDHSVKGFNEQIQELAKEQGFATNGTGFTNQIGNEGRKMSLSQWKKRKRRKKKKSKKK